MISKLILKDNLFEVGNLGDLDVNSNFAAINKKIKNELVQLVRKEINFAILKNVVDKTDILFNNFKKPNSILKRLQKLNQDSLKINDKVFSVKELLKID